MSGRIRRNSVYVVTIVAMLAMVGGFVTATYFGTLTLTNSGTAGAQGTASLISGTIYAGSHGAVNQLYGTTVVDCSGGNYCTTTGDTGYGCTVPGDTLDVFASAGTNAVYINGAAAATACTAGDEWLGLEFKNTGAIPSNAVDTFAFSISGGSAPTLTPQIQVGITNPTGTVGLEDLTIWIDLGAANPGYTSATVTITGS